MTLADLAWGLFLGILGACAGSYLLVVVERGQQGTATHEPSRCPACQHRLLPRDNVPIAGWLLLGGRCRHCFSPIPGRYLLVELAGAGVWGALAVTMGGQPAFGALLLGSWVLGLVYLSPAQRAPRAAAAASLPVAGIILVAAAVAAAANGRWALWALEASAALAVLAAGILISTYRQEHSTYTQEHKRR